MTDERNRSLPPGGDAAQRRRAFLDKRGLPVEEELEDEDEATDEQADDDECSGEGTDPAEPEDASDSD